MSAVWGDRRHALLGSDENDQDILVCMPVQGMLGPAPEEEVSVKYGVECHIDFVQ